MATRSRVGVMHGNIIKSVYCHYDGYLAHTGKILQAHYDSATANQLVALGNNNGIDETLEKMRFDTVREPNEQGWEVAHTFEEFLDQVHGCGGEYYYIIKDGVWYAGCVYETKGLIKEGLVELKQALSEALELEAA